MRYIVGWNSDLFKSKIVKLVYVASPLSMQRIKEKDKKKCLARNLDNVSEWNAISTLRYLYFVTVNKNKQERYMHGTFNITLIVIKVG